MCAKIAAFENSIFFSYSEQRKEALICNYSITVVCLFSPSLHPTPAKPTSLSSASTLPLGFVHVSFTVVPVIPSPTVPPPLPSGYETRLLAHQSSNKHSVTPCQLKSKRMRAIVIFICRSWFITCC